MDLQVAFGGRPVTTDSIISPLQAKKTINLCWGGQGLYSLIILDYIRNKVHFLATNIPGNQIEQGNLVKNYVVPDQGRYTVDLIQQKGPVTISATDLDGLNYKAFQQKFELTPIKRVKFMVDSSAPEFTSESY